MGGNGSFFKNGKVIIYIRRRNSLGMGQVGKGNEWVLCGSQHKVRKGVLLAVHKHPCSKPPMTNMLRQACLYSESHAHEEVSGALCGETEEHC